MKCYKCGNDIEDNLECPFCGYINKEETRKNIRVNDNKFNYSNNEKKNERYENDKVSNKVINDICKNLCYIQVAFSSYRKLQKSSSKRMFATRLKKHILKIHIKNWKYMYIT